MLVFKYKYVVELNPNGDHSNSRAHLWISNEHRREMRMSLGKDNVAIKFRFALHSRNSHTETTRHDTSRWDTVLPPREDIVLPDVSRTHCDDSSKEQDDDRRRCEVSLSKTIYTDLHILYAGDVAVTTKNMPMIIKATFAGSCRNCQTSLH